MFDWFKKRVSPAQPEVDTQPLSAKLHRRNNAGKYHLLYEYLNNRYAETVVLTFRQIEDLLGFTLPELARQDRDWWALSAATTAEARCSDAWTLARRTAQPNLMAQTVVFERVS